MEPKQVAPPDRPEPTPPNYEAYAVVLEDAIHGVLNAYGDKGWAQSEMCRRLRRALKDAKAASTRDVAVPARAHQEEQEDEMPLTRSGTTEIRDRQPAAVADAGSQKDCAGTKER